MLFSQIYVRARVCLRRSKFSALGCVIALVILLHIYIQCQFGSTTGLYVIFWSLISLRIKDDVQMFSTPGESNAPVRTKNETVIIYWTSVFGRKVLVGNRNEWPYFYAGDRCPVKCILTTDHSRLNEASAIVVHARNIDEMPPQDKIRRTNIRWILHSNESPKFTAALNSPSVMAKFNFYLSYRLDSDFPLSLFHKPSLRPLPIPFNKKRKTLAVALYSHCEAVRTEYLILLMKHISIDSYGTCMHNTDLPKYIGTQKYERSLNSSTAIIDLYSKYKFTIVFMNSDCDYFVDEKLYHALSAGSVPVFMGSIKIREFLPGNLHNSIIEVRNFKTPEELAQYLLNLADDEKAYNRYLKWKHEGYKFPANYEQSPIGKLWDNERSVFCSVCARMASGDRGRDGLQVEKCVKKTIKDWVDQ